VTGERRQAAGIEPPYLHEDYKSTSLRAPRRPPLRIAYGPSELSGPPGELLAAALGGGNATDLTRQHPGEPLGERIIVHGRIMDAHGRPLAGTLVEVWQANAAGRYAHPIDQHPAPLDPNFTGAGWCLTDEEGRYRFVTIKPGAYPWKNHHNAWRPAHIHFSVFGRAFSQRLITQMYFPGDPLLAHDPIVRSVANPAVRDRLIASFDLGQTAPEWALAYRFDIALGGREASPQRTSIRDRDSQASGGSPVGTP
jgi:protocatechuate 3,4-dioxygenase, beta subunit